MKVEGVEEREMYTTAMRASAEVSGHEQEVKEASESVSEVDSPISISNTTPFPSSLVIDVKVHSFSDASLLYFALVIVKELVADDILSNEVVDSVKEENDTPFSSSTPFDASIRWDVSDESAGVNASCEMLTVDVDVTIIYGLNDVLMVV